MTSDSEEDGGSEGSCGDVDLGCLEKTEPWKLHSRFFPCKVGQKPAWLAFTENVPTKDDLRCPSCDKTRMFLLQLYAPVAEIESCFHRTLYVFVCNTGECLKSGETCFKVLRCQLPRTNPFYPSEPPVLDENYGKEICAERFNLELCNVCGIRCNLRCATCKIVSYCCKEHQVYDWKNGHKTDCKTGQNTTQSQRNVSFLFPEHEIVIKPERLRKPDVTNDEIIANELVGSLAGIPCEEELSRMALADEDKRFTRFRERTKASPNQVLRYERDGCPLWVSDKNVPSKDEAANCPYCGSKRTFEFQIMPQLLNYLDLELIGCESLDWGTVAIYTCEKSCNDSATDYKEEVAVKQDFS